MTTYEAVEIIEGIGGSRVSRETELAAWSELVRSGAAWNLQGFYGREATRLIEAGLLTRNGDITTTETVHVIKSDGKTVTTSVDPVADPQWVVNLFEGVSLAPNFFGDELEQPF